MAVMQSDQATTAPPRCETIEELFEALESPLLAYALRLTADMAVAEDVFQEAFMKLHEQFSEIREPKRWLYRTVHNLAVNQLRNGSKIVPLQPEQYGSGGQGAETVDPQPIPDEQIVRLEGIG